MSTIDVLLAVVVGLLLAAPIAVAVLFYVRRRHYRDYLRRKASRQARAAVGSTKTG